MIKRRFYIDFGRSADHALDYFLGIVEDARVTTVQQVEKLPIEALHWQYQPGWNTIGALLSHITAIEHYFRIEFVEGRKLTDEENKRWGPALDMGDFLPRLITNEPVEKYIAGLEESRRLLLEALKNVTFEDFAKRRAGYDEETGCNLAWVLYHMAEDEVHHRGQISLLRKLYKSATQV
ncbi:MAG TPA: DinB family protein [Pyrinomonadaceae bacterium]|jgi:uncharacterized damage-inducible protein DinB